MSLSKLELESFRNFSQAKLRFTPPTAIIGANGVGKSNLLEAIRLLSVGKSFKTNRLDEAIRFDQLYFRLAGSWKADDKQEIEFFYGRQFADSPLKERRLTVNGKPINLLDFFGRAPTVLFIPSDLNLILGSPRERRQFMDGIFWQLDRQFRQDHLELNRILIERLALLSAIKYGRSVKGELKPWNELLGRLTSSIQKKRQGLVGHLGEHLALLSSQLKRRFDLRLRYQSNLQSPETVLESELRLSQNLIGPQRDELEITLNGRTARRYASRGQIRSAVILLKLAEINYLEEKLTPPLVLLDDLTSELDHQHTEELLSLFLNRRQIIITSLKELNLLKDWQIIKLD